MRLKPEKSGFAMAVFIVAGVIVVAGIAIGVVSTVFHRAYVSVTPNAFSVNVQESVPATPDSQTLPYQEVSVTDTASKTVAATGSQQVQNHASGTITIYNAYSTAQQRFITNTRFQTASGLLFRIHAPVVVPGYTMKAGVKVPGTVQATVYADQAGDTYNIPASDFTIPGLTNATQHRLIYAQSVSSMSGGFGGAQAVVDPILRTQTVTDLEASLDRSLRSKVAAATMAGTVVFNDSIAITYTQNPDSLQGSNAVISVSGQALAPAFNENDLAHQIGSTANVSYTGDLAIKNPASLNVTVNPANAIGTQTPITASISGTADLVATFDPTALAKDLAGKSKKDIQSVLPSYPAISAIDVKIYPFWISSLPSDPAKVEITTVDTPPATTP